jgi:site-specific DNA-cytosine methylase
MSKKKLTYASIVPLIGGETLGVMQALDGQLPEYVLSYAPFGDNDSHFIKYLREKKDWKGDYAVIDTPEYENYKPKQVDVVNSVCPCAGLSSLSVSSSADSPVNEWLYTTAEYVLANVKPKVFWGENAPRLFSSVGKKVADKLFEIGQKYGYSLNLYYTESRLHGLCQKRPRTFYFFTKSDTAPIFKTWRRDLTPVEDLLKKKTLVRDKMNVLINKNDPADNAWVAYAVHKTGAGDVKGLYEKFESTTNLIVAADKRLGATLLEVADWMDEQGRADFSHIAKRARAMQGKLDDDKGYWAHGVTLAKGIIPSLIGAMPGSLINPFTGTFLTLRDCLRIMGMPDDFDLAHDNPVSKTNHICQNVPVGTAADMMAGIVDYLDGKCDYTSSAYVKQSNKNLRYDSELPTNNTADLDSFF